MNTAPSGKFIRLRLGLRLGTISYMMVSQPTDISDGLLRHCLTGQCTGLAS